MMSKIFTNLMFWGILLLGNQLYAHTTFASLNSITENNTAESNESAQLMDITLSMDDVTAQNGDQICVDVTVDNFIDILGMQFSINYDAAQLEFVSVGNFGLTGLNQNLMGLPGSGTSPGDITLSWIDNSLSGVTLANGTVLFELCFNVLGSDVTTNIEFSGMPTSVQFLDSNDNVLPPDFNNSTVTIGGGGNGGGNNDEVGINFSSASGENGDQICLDVTVENFDNILGLQFSIDYDPALLQFASVGNFGLTGLNANLMGLPGSGTTEGDITLSWIDNSLAGVSLADGTVLFELCFNIVGNSGNAVVSLSDSPTTIQILDSDDNILPYTTDAGIVTISGGNGGGGNNGDFGINFSDASGSNGDQVCLDVTVENFTDILGLQFSIDYDPNQLEFASVGNFGLAGLNANLMGLPGSGTSEGDITLSWIDNSLAGVSLADGTVLFELCFNIVGNSGSATVDISDSPTTIQILDNNDNVLPYTSDAGTVTISGGGGGGNNGDFGINFSDASGSNGDQVCLDVTVENFTDILGLQFSIDYDPSQLEFASVGNFGLAGLNANLMGLPGSGTSEGDITLSWIDNSLAGVSLADGTVLFELCFNIVGNSGSATVDISDSPTTIQILDNNDNVLPYTSDAGTVTISGGGGGGNNGDFGINFSDASGSNGDQVCLDVTVENFTDILGLQFSIDYDPSQLEFASVGNFGLAGLNANLMGLPGSGTSEGDITLSWIDNSLAGVSLADGTVLFELCFNIVGNSGSATVDISDSPTTIQILDNNDNVLPYTSDAGTVTISGGGGGGNNGDFGINFSDASGSNGDQVCLDVTVENFTDILGLQFSIDYDPSQLEFASVGNFGLAGLNANLMGLPGSGTSEGDITLSWIDNSLAGVSLADGTVLFELCFNIVGNSGSATVDISDSPTTIQILDNNDNVLPYTSDAGTVTISGGGGGGNNGDFTFNISDDNVTMVGGQACVEVSVENFTDILGLQFSINYDPSILEFVSVGNFGLTGLNENLMGLPTGGTQEGQITVSWIDNSLAGVSLSDGTVLFELCFNTLAGGSSEVEISNNPTSVQVLDNNDNVLPYNANAGTVNVTGGPPPPMGDDFTLIISDEFVQTSGSSVCVEVTTQNFTNILGMQFSVNYNPSKLTFESVGNFNLDGLNQNLMGLPNGNGTQAGNITVSWIDNALAGITLPDNTVLFEICFTADLTSGTTPVELSNTPTSIQILDNNDEVLMPTLVDGSVSIGNPGDGLKIDIEDATVCSDDNETFCVGVTVEDFTDILGMQFSIVYDPTDLEYSSVGNFNLDGLNANLMGLPEGGPTSTQPGVITLSWIDNALSGVSLPDGTEIFEICFEPLAPEGTTSNIEFSNMPTSIQVIDINDAQVPFIDEPGVITFDCNQFSAPVIQEPATITNNDCFGDMDGSISISVNGGSGDFSYAWSSPAGVGSVSMIDNLSAGNYTVTVTDNMSGQTAIKTYTITQPATPVTINSIDVTDIVCPGENSGAISVNASGGTGTLSYSWTPNAPATASITNLSAGEFYRVTITDANGCEEVSSFIEVAEPEAIATNAVVTDIACSGEANGSIDITPSGGTGSLFVDWDVLPDFQTSHSNLSAGTYTVTISDGNNCELVESFQITDPDPIVINEQVQDVECAGDMNGFVNLNVSGGSASAGYSIDWADAGLTDDEGTQMNLAAGSYEVTITDDNNCSIVEVIDINEPSAIELNPTVENVLCAGENSGTISLNITGGTPNPDYAINWGGPLPDGQSMQAQLPAGTYPVTVTDGNGCAEIQNITVEEPNAPIIVTAMVEDIACEGGPTGSISLSISGGTPGNAGYAIDWATLTDGEMMQENLEAGNYTVSVTDENGCETVESFVVNSDAPIFINGTVEDVSCAGESDGGISITLAGGSQNFDISWDGPGVDPLEAQQVNLGAGEYTITVTDTQSGCEKIETFEVAEPGELAATADIQNAACFAEATGSVVLDVTGGTENYTIDWSGGIAQNETNPTGLLADDYMVTITDANGCTLEQTITVGEAAEISVMADLTNINCSGDETGAISISISGGTPMYTRDWTDLPDNLNTQNNLGAGTYELVITDANGCNETVSFELTEPDPIELNEVVEYVDLGNDGSVDLSTTGGVEPYTFEWSGPNTFSSSSEDLNNLNDIGEYCVTVTDANGCVYEECLDVRLRLQFGFETIQFSCGDLDNGLIDLEVLGGLEPYTFDWDVTGAADSPLLDGVGAGTYTVTVTDAEGTQITGTFEVGEYPGLVVSETLTPAQGLVNNFNGAINLNISGGAQPYDIIWDNGFTTANISGLQAGTYCVTITDANGCTFEECYIIEFIPDELEIEESIAIEANCSGDDNGRLLITVYGGIPPYTMTININGTDEVITSVNREFEIEGLAAGSYSYTVVDGNGDMVAGSETVEEPDPLTLQGFNVRHDTELTGPGIGTGRIQLNIQGGTPNYSVTWLGTPLQGPTIISLDSEIYTPQVVDSRGCTIIFPEIEVEEFAIDLEGTPAVCTGDENGAVDLVITDGDMPYTFSWELENGGTATTEDINNLPAGTYTVTVTENSGNTLVENITIGTQSNLQLEAEVATNYNGFDVSCADSADGEVSANAIFNGAACTDCDYEWVLEGELLGVNQTLTDARPGTYELTVIDPLMCENIQEVVLVAPDPLVLNSNIQEVACPGDRNGVITVMVTGGVGGFFDYDWSNGSSTFQNANLSSGTYALTVSDDNNCEVSDLFELVDPAPLEINLQIENDTDPEGCNGSVWAVVNGGFPPYTYDWSTLEVDETQALVESVCPGAYVVSVTDVRGCTQVSTVGNVLNRSFDCLEERIVITPDGNGSNDEFIINCIEELMENHLEVYNRWGQLVFETDNYDNTWEGTSQNGDVLPEGPYFFVLDYRDPITNEMTQYRGSMTILKE